MSEQAHLGATVLGYPRIGPDRELKRALERYWAGTIDQTELHKVATTLRVNTCRELADAGLDTIPSNTFSYYDHVLDNAALFGALPDRFTTLGLDPTDTYFAAARGVQDAPALEMTKWFDTNYHYLVPELGPNTRFALSASKPLDEYREAKGLGIETRPVLVGPATFLLLSKPDPSAPESFQPIELLDSLVTAYVELLGALHDEGAEWVQLDEPAYVADRTDEEIAALARAYQALGSVGKRPKILLASYFGGLDRDTLGALARCPIDALGVDLVTDPHAVDAIGSETALRDKELLAGVVDGRNVWRVDVDEALSKAATLLGSARSVGVSTSCSLLHVPYDVDVETALDERVRGWLAFAKQKVHEVVLLGRTLTKGTDATANELASARAATRDRAAATDLHDEHVRARRDALRPEDTRRGDYPTRAAAQQDALDLPVLPTTTIGSFPQTAEVRKTRAAFRAGTIDEATYRASMRAEIEQIVRMQERLGLDVLVHGEPERNDMVQYFAEQLAGFAATEYGWVQSYGSRCVRPPILYGDVSRPQPMTVQWASHAQSLTDKPIKGMLTAPVTILAWSFVRDDQPMNETALQVALAIRDEVCDLESAGVRIIQVDEPALRELLPLRARDRKDYFDWAVQSFQVATSGVADATQIHTHMCYSEFGDILPAIDAIDADVTSIEAARSRMEVLGDLNSAGFGRGIGPGVYDIHSPRVPRVAEIAELLRAGVQTIPATRLWVNPDCGLKTRGYPEIEPALANMVTAAEQVRQESAQDGWG